MLSNKLKREWGEKMASCPDYNQLLLPAVLRKPVLDSKGCMREWVKTVKDLERENLTGKAQQDLSNTEYLIDFP